MDNLERLECRVLKDLEFINYPSRSWVPPRFDGGKPVFDVIIVGAGQCGLATAFGLLREKITNILVLDSQPSGKEGPWKTYARMRYLRTPKEMTGLDFGIPSLTLRAWYEAQYGEPAWQSTERISRELWQDYLDWFRKVLALPVRNLTLVQRIAPHGDFISVLTDVDGRSETLVARKVVLASGLPGNGEWFVPDDIKKNISVDRYAHASEDINFNDLAGKRVGVIGSGASAFDNAATALQYGAARVEVCARRSSILTINLSNWMQFTGFLAHYADMSESQKWAFTSFILDRNQPPTQETFDRCRYHSNFVLNTGCGLRRAEMDMDGSVAIKTSGGDFKFDFLIVATGYRIDLSCRSELSGLADAIALWGDRFTPPPGLESKYVAAFPYLGPSYEFLEKIPGTAPFLRNIHNFTFGAMPSLGISGSSITGMKYGTARLVAGITRQIYLDDVASHQSSLETYAAEELILERASIGK
jgi:FAD-dependent urate hydroxylase